MNPISTLEPSHTYRQSGNYEQTNNRCLTAIFQDNPGQLVPER